jgi:anti-anti-sigma factor
MTQLHTDLSLEITDDGCIATVQVRGELDLATAPQVRACLTELYGSGRRRVVLDLSELDFIDSTGLGVLVAALKRFRSDGGELAVVNPTNRVRKVFELTRLDGQFLIA